MQLLQPAAELGGIGQQLRVITTNRPARGGHRGKRSGSPPTVARVAAGIAPASFSISRRVTPNERLEGSDMDSSWDKIGTVYTRIVEAICFTVYLGHVDD